MTENSEESPLKFPCAFPIKIMGRDEEALHIEISEVISRHAPDTKAENIKRRLSKKKNYVSVTVTINATSRKQLDNIYRELTASKYTLFVL